jgi:hypothetical protein
MHPMARCIIQHGGVLEPGVARSRAALERSELRVDSVAQDHLDVMQGLKRRSRDPRVPDVEGEA